MYKKPRDIIFLHMCTINENHVMSGSWDARCNRQSFLLFWVIFCPFTPLTIQKIKILKKWKKLLEISWFYTSVSKIMIISYTIPEIWRMTDVIVNFHFGIFFALSVKAYKIKIKKNEKKKTPADIIMCTCVSNNMIRWCTVPEIWCRFHCFCCCNPKISQNSESFYDWNNQCDFSSLFCKFFISSKMFVTLSYSSKWV